MRNVKIKQNKHQMESVMFKIVCSTFLSIFCFCFLPAHPYFQLDNKTPADFDDVLDDPFLVIRSKIGGPHTPMNWESSWKSWAEIESRTDLSLPPQEHCYFAPFILKKTGTLEVSAQPIFDHIKPSFTITFLGKELPNYMWWQISSDPDFQTVVSNLNVQIPFAQTIRLSDLEETFLNTGQVYYFRVCADCANWSQVYSFHVQKPVQIQEVEFIKLNKQHYELSWKRDPSPSATYLIFASNAHDFIPSILFDEQLNTISATEGSQKEKADNFICETCEPLLIIEGEYAYYRIISCDKGQLSVPSSLIYVYDQSLTPFRTRLKRDPEDPTCFQRQSLPSHYEHEKEKLYPLIERISNYLHNHIVPLALWEKLEPYFLPVNHPIKERLDRLFKKIRATQSEETFEKAGFGKPKMRKPGNIVIGRNPNFSKYIFKVYLDTQIALNEWENWVKRIEGSRAIQSCIDRHGYTHFSTPRKWIYPLPEEPSPPSSPRYHRKNFILIVDNMNILSPHDNLEAYKTKLSPSRLEELYTILSEEGLIDSVYPDNIPFTKKGKIAFIDTEHFHLAPVPYDVFTRFLSPKMQQHWQSIINVNK